MSFAGELARMREGAASRIAPETLATIHKGITDLISSGIAEKSLKEGDSAPDFALPNATGGTVRLADLRAKGPVVISFYRGGWCPYCNLELKALQQRLPEIAELGASLVAVSPETPDHSLTTAEKHALGFDVLSDEGNAVARRFGLVFEIDDDIKPIYENFGIDLERQNGDGSWQLPIPATYVIDADGSVRKAYANADYTDRLDPADVVATLRQAKEA